MPFTMLSKVHPQDAVYFHASSRHLPNHSNVPLTLSSTINRKVHLPAFIHLLSMWNPGLWSSFKILCHQNSSVTYPILSTLSMHDYTWAVKQLIKKDLQRASWFHDKLTTVDLKGALHTREQFYISLVNPFSHTPPWLLQISLLDLQTDIPFSHCEMTFYKTLEKIIIMQKLWYLSKM